MRGRLVFRGLPDKFNEWRQKGLCRMCGKPKSKWDKGRRVQCSKECETKYEQCMWYPGRWRTLILKKANGECAGCKKIHYKETLERVGDSYERVQTKQRNVFNSMEADHIKPIFLGGDEYDVDNGQALCLPCHKKKTAKESKLFAQKRKRRTVLKHTKSLEAFNE